ncbi:MAG: hypothetical protein ABW194_02505 [Novosphingobium sp.]
MAFFKGSAYERVPGFEPDAAGTVPFRGIRARALRTPEAVLEHTVALRDRLDSVAHDYFAEARDWRWLVETNREVLFPEDLLWTADAIGPADDPSAEIGSERVGRVVIVPRRKEGGG